MNKSTLEPILREHPFFKEFSPTLLNILVGCASNVRFDAGAYLTREGEPANHFYLLRHGEVNVEIAVPGKGFFKVETLHEGDVVGWSWLFPPYRWNHTVSATTLVRAIALDGACLRDKAEQDCGLGYELMKRFNMILLDRLQATRMQVMDVYGK